MKDFILAALPFIILGVCVIIICKCNKNNKNKDNTYILEGMVLGMGFGLMLGTMPNYNTGLCLLLGMVIGEAIGCSIEKKDNMKKN